MKRFFTPVIVLALLGLVSVILAGRHQSVPVARAQAPDGLYVPIEPQRIVDTRATGRRLEVSANGAHHDFDLVGSLAVDDAVKAGVIGLFMNVTILDADVPGYVVAYPANQSRPDASVSNFGPGDVVTNGVFLAAQNKSPTRLTLVASDSKSGLANVIIDVVGYVTSDVEQVGASRLVSTSPHRVFDSRHLAGSVAGGSRTRVDFTSSESGVVAVAVNVTVKNRRAESADTFIGLLHNENDVWPATSLVNVAEGQTVSNFSIIPVDVDGEAVFFNAEGETNLIIDEVGYFTTDDISGTAAGRIVLLDAPFRVLDSRPRPLETGQRATWDFEPFLDSLSESRSGLSGVDSFFGNLTAVNLRRRLPGLVARSYLTLSASGDPKPETSNINVSDGMTIANSGLFTASSSGIDIYNDQGTVDYLLDVNAVVTR